MHLPHWHLSESNRHNRFWRTNCCLREKICLDKYFILTFVRINRTLLRLCSDFRKLQKGSAFASLKSIANSDSYQKLFLHFENFVLNVGKLVRSHKRQRYDIHFDALQFLEITDLTSVQLILTNVRIKFLSMLIFSLKQQLVLSQNRLRRFDSDKGQWGRCMALMGISVLPKL